MSNAPVFVDPSGRRARWVTRICWGVASLLVAYVALVVLALVAPPNVLPLGLGPLLPRPAAPSITSPSGTGVPLGHLLDQLRTSARPARVRSSPAAGNFAAPTPTAAAVHGKRPASPAPAPTPTSSTPGKSGSRPTARPSHTPPPHP